LHWMILPDSILDKVSFCVDAPNTTVAGQQMAAVVPPMKAAMERVRATVLANMMRIESGDVVNL